VSSATRQAHPAKAHPLPSQALFSAAEQGFCLDSAADRTHRSPT